MIMAQIRLRYICPAFVASLFILLPSLTHAQVTLSPTEQLMELNEIYRLKARYFRHMDRKEWTEWGELFTEDATLVATAFGTPIIWRGREQIVAENSAALSDAKTVHHGHMPEINLTSDTEAEGVWSMEDYLVFFGNTTLQGAGHYVDFYRKVNGEWKIYQSYLLRLREDLGTLK
jgi:hypothetical protein